MVTFEQLQEKLEKTQLESKPIKEKLEAVKAELKAKLDEIASEFGKHLENYLDQKLQDKQGRPIQVGSVLSKKGNKYKVISRGMQFIFGAMFNNPRIEIALIKPDGTVSGKTRPIYSSELEDIEWIDYGNSETT